MMLIPLSYFGAQKDAVRLAVEVEMTHGHGRALGLTPEAVDAVIRERSAEASKTPWPLDWRAVRAALSNITASTSKETTS